ncbi:hypothetical protein ILYODFUR_023801, partial [Ilyodon furcidens]
QIMGGRWKAIFYIKNPTASTTKATFATGPLHPITNHPRPSGEPWKTREPSPW